MLDCNVFIFVDAAQAIQEQREKNKTARKRKIEFLKEQKEKKKQRLQEMEENKLSTEFLESINNDEPTGNLGIFSFSYKINIKNEKLSIFVAFLSGLL